MFSTETLSSNDMIVLELRRPCTDSEFGRLMCSENFLRVALATSVETVGHLPALVTPSDGLHLKNGCPSSLESCGKRNGDILFGIEGIPMRQLYCFIRRVYLCNQNTVSAVVVARIWFVGPSKWARMSPTAHLSPLALMEYRRIVLLSVVTFHMFLASKRDTARKRN